MSATYLLIDFSVLVVPLVFSFHPRIRFDRLFRRFLPATAVAALPFIAWDALFAAAGIWGFDDTYLLGPSLVGLPVEELLFFFCIPYACVFTFYCLSMVRGFGPGPRTQRGISLALLLLLVMATAVFYDRAYTLTTCTLLAATLCYLEFIRPAGWLGRFYASYAVLLIPFFIVNGVLTGLGADTPVVWYNPDEHIGVRLLTIPLEDVFYGMLLICWNLIALSVSERASGRNGDLQYI